MPELMKDTLTYFAAPERLDETDLAGQAAKIKNLDNISQFLDALSQVAMVLNSHRQVVYANRVLLDSLGLDSPDCLVGMRPGEIVNCVHAGETEAGCGTSEACRLCGAVNAIKDVLEKGERSARECRIDSRTGDHHLSLDWKVTASPVVVEGERFVLFSVVDISDEKMRRALENSLARGALNIASNMESLVEEMLENAGEDESSAELNELGRYSRLLVDEILEKRILLKAETGDILFSFSTFSLHVFLDDLAVKYQVTPLARDRRIEVEGPEKEIIIHSDRGLLAHVVGFLLKNALEAAPPRKAVKMICSSDSRTASISIWNPGEISRDVQLQLFQRSFSTHARYRGFGCYGARLLAEKYLKGNISFESTAAKGTSFTISLPL